MSQFLDAAEKVLRDAGRALSPEKLTEAAVARGLLASTGKTPSQTMKSKLSMDVLAKGASSRFMRTSKGAFGLREWRSEGIEEYQADRYRKALLDEEVVVFPATLVSSLLHGDGLQLGKTDVAEVIARSSSRMVRRIAEDDPSVVQLVSVFIVRYQGKFLTYKRTKRLPEQRLHGTYSMFFGGHVTPSELVFLFDPFDPQQSAMFFERELLEELHFPQGMPHIAPKGLLYDTSAAVSRQHLGLVFDVRLDSPDYTIGERGFLIDSKFESLDEIRARLDDFENWSVRITEFEQRLSTCQS